MVEVGVGGDICAGDDVVDNGCVGDVVGVGGGFGVGVGDGRIIDDGSGFDGDRVGDGVHGDGNADQGARDSIGIGDCDFACACSGWCRWWCG
jgi:hypothetical protein